MRIKFLSILLFFFLSILCYSQTSTKLVEERIIYNVKNNLPRYNGIQFSIKVKLINTNENLNNSLNAINEELKLKFNLYFQTKSIDENNSVNLIYFSDSKISIQTIKAYFISKELNLENIENLMFLKQD
jgi:hypothetical protein